MFIDPTVDGVKTGHTESAGYCLIASARRDQRRLVSVVLGANSDNARAMESLKLLNYGFQSFETVRLYPGNQAVSTLRLYKGGKSEIGAGFLADFYITVPRGSGRNIQAQVMSRQPLLAPLRRGERIATLRLSSNGVALADYPMVALDSVPVAGLFGRTWDNLLLMFK